MIRLLIIGPQAPKWGEAARGWRYERLEVDEARRPAEGLRGLEATPPDAVVVVEEARPERAATLVDALRERPVGRLIPVIVIGPEGDEGHGADRWLGPSTGAQALREVLEEEFGESLDTPLAPEVSAPDGADEGVQYVLEELDSPATPSGVGPARRMTRDGLVTVPQHLPAVDTQADEERVRRKLKQVRHADYFAILEVRRGSSSQTIREAFHRLWSVFSERELAFEVAHLLADELDEIRDALEDAWAVLGDPSLRRDYLEHTTRK